MKFLEKKYYLNHKMPIFFSIVGRISALRSSRVNRKGFPRNSRQVILRLANSWRNEGMGVKPRGLFRWTSAPSDKTSRFYAQSYLYFLGRARPRKIYLRPRKGRWFKITDCIIKRRMLSTFTGPLPPPSPLFFSSSLRSISPPPFRALIDPWWFINTAG